MVCAQQEIARPSSTTGVPFQPGSVCVLHNQEQARSCRYTGLQQISDRTRMSGVHLLHITQPRGTHRHCL